MATRRKKRRRRKPFPVSFVATFAVLLGLIAIMAYLPQFRLKQVAVYGNTSLLAQDIMPVVEPSGDPFFVIGLGPDLEHWTGLRYGSMEAELQRLFPILEEVTVRFQFPSTVRVELIDKPEVVTARVPQGYALLDSQARVISLRDVPSALLPVTEGFRLTGTVTAGERLPVEDTQFQSAMRVTAAMIAADEAFGYSQKLMRMTRQITLLDGQIRLDMNLENEQRWRVTVEDNSLIGKNMATLAYLIEEGKLKDRGNGEIVLAADEIIFKPDSP